MVEPIEVEDSAGAALPLRMIVEWAYCPRLFHYMHVEGVMVANEHVWRGRHAHARADAPGNSKVRRAVAAAASAAPPESEETDALVDLPAEWREARAVDLEATDLGVIAKLDGVLLDGAGTAIPVELKVGSAPDADSRYSRWAPGAWDSDALHVAIQALALERAGYAVPRAEIFYRASRTRVLVALTEELRAEALRVIAAAREAQRSTVRPPPLDDSPKCRGCSLVEVCLPDESRLLREGVPADEGLDEALDPDPTAPLPAARLARGRRLVASAMETRTVTVSTAGASVRKEGEALLLVPPPDSAAKPTRVALDSIDALVIMGSPNVSTHAIMACLERGIAVSFHQANGRLLGSVGSGLGSNVALRVAQHAWAGDPAKSLSVAREFVRGKIKNQRVLLRRHGVLDDGVADEWESLTRGIDKAADGDALRGVEGRAARLYFDAYARLLRERGGEAFTMDGRNRRPPRDPVNAMLSFGYAILARECAEVLRRVGFDPMRGFLHGMGWGRPALGLDLMEELRALVVDSTVLRVVAEKRVTGGDFVRELQGVALKPGARRTFLQALDQRREEEITHPVFGYKVSYRRAVELQARVLARVLEGEAERYVALTTR
jgi:CRISPR-associated endonuclease Cas1/CRISPR-associated protein Cas4